MKRIRFLDDVRGITLLSMIFFHGVWDLVFIFGMDWEWFYSPFAYVWQQSICWTFIFLSGFCWSFGKKRLRRGVIVSAAGFVVSLVTALVTPEQIIKFGVLTLLGFAMLVMIPLEKLLEKVKPQKGFMVSLICFIILRNINDGNLGFEGLKLLELPKELYHMGDVATFIGFTDVRFYSADYFSVLPWFFLFVTGYFGYRIAFEEKFLEKISAWHIPGEFFGAMGRQSLIIYMLHQPIIYLGLSLYMYFS